MCFGFSIGIYVLCMPIENPKHLRITLPAILAMMPVGKPQAKVQKVQKTQNHRLSLYHRLTP